MRGKVAAATLVLLAGAGCDGIDAGRDAGERAREPEQRSVDTGRVEITVLPSEDGAELPKALQMKIDVDIAEGGDLMALVIDAGDVAGGDPNGPEAEMILVEDDELYLRLLVGKERLPRGKSWIRMDAEEVERLVPEFEGITRFADTKEVLSTSSLPEDDATGTETIGGVETTRYELSAGLEEMDEVAGIPEGLLEELQGATGDELNMTTWLDEDGFMRRMRFPMRAAYLVPRLEDEDDVVLQFDVSDLGEEIAIELPPEKKVLSL